MTRLLHAAIAAGGFDRSERWRSARGRIVSSLALLLLLRGVATAQMPAAPATGASAAPSPLLLDQPPPMTRDRRPLMQVRLAVASASEPSPVPVPDPATLEVNLDGVDVSGWFSESGPGRQAGRPPLGSELPLGLHRLDVSAKGEGGGRFASTRSFYVLRPAIENVEPADALPGSRVTITGAGFDAGVPPQVFVSGRPAEVVESGDRRIVAVVPADAVSGGVTVLAGDVETQRFPFRVVRVAGLRDISGFAVGPGGVLWVLDAGVPVERSLLRVLPGEEGRPAAFAGIPEPRGPALGRDDVPCAATAAAGDGDAGEITCWASTADGWRGGVAGSAGCIGCSPSERVVPLALASLGSGFLLLDALSGSLRYADGGGDSGVRWAAGFPTATEALGPSRGSWRGAILVAASPADRPAADPREVWVGLGDRLGRVVAPPGVPTGGVVHRLVAAAEGFGRIVGLAEDDREGILVADEATGEILRVERRDPTRRSVLASGLDRPRGVAFRRIDGQPEVLVAEATRGIGLAGPSLELLGTDPRSPLELKAGIRVARPDDDGEGARPGVELEARVTPTRLLPTSAGSSPHLEWSWKVVELPAEVKPESVAEALDGATGGAWVEMSGFPLTSREGKGETEVADGLTRVRFVPPSLLPDGTKVVVTVRADAPPWDALEAQTPPLVVRNPQLRGAPNGASR